MSLPAQFLIAIGLVYILFPLLVLVAGAVIVVLVPGDHRQTNSLLRKPIYTLRHTFSREDGKFQYFPSVAMAAFFVVGVAKGLIWAVGSSHHTLVVILAIASPIVCLGLCAPIAIRWRHDPDALPAVALAALIAGAIFTGWAIDFAVVRAAFPEATVCTSQGDRLAGPYIGETGSRVYIGEPPVRIAAAVRPRVQNLLEEKLDAHTYGLHFVPRLTKRNLLTADLAIVDLDLVHLRIPQPISIPVYGYFHKGNAIVRQAASQEGVKPLKRERKFEHLASDSKSFSTRIKRLIATRTRATANDRDLQIVSVPTTDVTRVLITAHSARGHCPVTRAASGD